ncbi:beta/gamma crystallin domain-containing protein [Aeromonas jandaei]|uniref:beta/gamma crystallin domain-containing protein n=1 Tax=Aeromonas jandaei TaxID=650 RepID=UPI00366D527F
MSVSDRDTPKQSTASFYRQLNFGGSPERYLAGSDVTFSYGDNFNDKYLSLIVDDGLKVRCHQHSDGSGIYKEYKTGSYKNMGGEIGGLSKFQVLTNQTSFMMAVQLQTKVPGYKPGEMSMDFNAADIGSVTALNEYGYVSLPSSATTNYTVCAVYVRDLMSGIYLATGSVYFRWDELAGIIVINDNDSNLPYNLTYMQDSATSFTFTLESLSD